MFKIFDDLTAEQQAVLEASVLKRQYLPIIFDEEGNCLDGRQRLKVYEKHGITRYEKHVIDTRNMAHEDVQIMIAEINRQRRGADSREELHKVIDSFLRAIPDLSDRYTAEILFTDHKTVAKRRKLLIANEEIKNFSRKRGSDGRRWYKTKIITLTPKETKQAQDDITSLPPEETKEGTFTARRFKSRSAKTRREKLANQEVEGYNPEADICPYHCEFADLPQVAKLNKNSVGLVYTDPLYQKKYIDGYEQLSKFAAEYLIEGGFCVAYTGTMYLPEFMERMGKHLTFHWLGGIIHNAPAKDENTKRKISSSAVAFNHQFINNIRLVLFYTKGKARKLRGMVSDLSFTDSERDKDLHEYQQSMKPIYFWVDWLSFPGELVVDPFMGSGSVAQACRVKKRRFVGCDRSEAAHNSTLRRLADLQKEDPHRMKR